MKKSERIIVGLVVLAGIGFSSVTHVPILWAEEGKYSTEGYEQSGRDYIWKQSITENADGLQSAEFNTVNGKVIISPQEGKNTVDVQAEIVIRRGFFGSETTVLTTKEQVGVKVERAGDKLIIRADQPKKSSWRVSIRIDFTVKIPAALAAHAETVNGKVEITGIQAPLSLHTVNGSLTAENCLGPIQADSVNGSIHLKQIAQIDKVTTVNGSISAEIQDEMKNNSSFETVNGSVKIDIPEQTRADLDLGNVNGSIELKANAFQGEQKKHNVNGTLNGGGAKLSVHTVNGGISVY